MQSISIPNFISVAPPPADESNQAYTFRVLNSTCDDIFASDPTVSPTDGTLSFELFPLSGSECSLGFELIDDGGQVSCPFSAHAVYAMFDADIFA